MKGLLNRKQQSKVVDLFFIFFFPLLCYNFFLVNQVNRKEKKNGNGYNSYFYIRINTVIEGFKETNKREHYVFKKVK